MIYKETPTGIADWASEVFGLEATIKTMAARVNVEGAELHFEMVRRQHEKVAEEAADVYITMCHMAARLQSTIKQPCVFPYVFYSPSGYMPDLIPALSSLIFHAYDPIISYSLMYAMRNVINTLQAIADTYLFDLAEEVDKKMAINRGRTWNVVNGVGQHLTEVR